MSGNPERDSANQLQKQPVHQLQKQRVLKAGKRPTDKISSCCYRCGKQGHEQFECWFKDVKCFGCSKIGHAKTVCHTVRKTAQKENSGRGAHKIGYEEAQSDTNEDEKVELISGNIHTLHKRKEAYKDKVDCTRAAIRDGNRHRNECQYCERNNMKVSLEER